ncbi:MAG: peptidase M4 [Longimicrobiales bacterium]
MAKKTKPVFYEISQRFRQQAHVHAVPTPAHSIGMRPLRIYTLDPSVSHRLGGTATVNVPLEALEPGPAGALFEIDGGKVPKPLEAAALDLNTPHLLMSSGLGPTPANGQFHLQMVYAVCSLTYARFKRALGRDIAWACGVPHPETGQLRLRVRPFAVQERNAFYDRNQSGLCFGYFRAPRHAAGFTVPGGLVFTALSHDVIVHETTHALLDALRPEFYTPTNPDVLGFHEGLADIVALFQHFSYADVVEKAMREARGVLSRASLLSNLAQEFGHALSSPEKISALRSGVDVSNLLDFDSDVLPPGARTRRGLLTYKPDLPAHRMGSVLVSAVFEAFITVFRKRSERYFRIAGIAPDAVGQADLSGELVKVLASEASELAGQFLDICIRAIDYCPTVDMDLCEYLRALITADADVVSVDKYGYRDALLRSFHRRDLFPAHVGFMSEDAVMWDAPATALVVPELAFSQLRFNGDPGHVADPQELERQAHALGAFVTQANHAPHLGLIAPGAKLPKNVQYAGPVSVQSIRCARRVAPDGHILFDLVGEVTQTCTVRAGNDLIEFSAGCTLVIDPFGQVRYAIYKRADSADRQERQLKALRGPLKAYWRKAGRKYVPRAGTFQQLHLDEAAEKHPGRRSGNRAR